MTVNPHHCSIDDFVDYASRFEPSFVKQIRGATQEEIEELQRACGYPLPETYRCFLSRMGHKLAPPLEHPWDCWMDVGHILEYYRTEVEPFVSSIGSPVPENHILIGIEGPHEHCTLEDLVQDVYLELNPPIEPRLVHSMFRSGGELRADSLANGFCRELFWTRALSQFPHLTNLVDPDARTGGLKSACDFAQSLGFQPEWFSDSTEFCGTRHDAAVRCSQSPDSGIPLNVCVAGLVSSEVERMCSLFMQKFPLLRIFLWPKKK